MSDWSSNSEPIGPDVFVNVGGHHGATGFVLAKRCNASMNKAQLIVALATSGLFKKAFVGVSWDWCDIYVQGSSLRVAIARNIHRNAGILLGDFDWESPIDFFRGNPSAVYLYIDTSKAAGKRNTGWMQN